MICPECGAMCEATDFDEEYYETGPGSEKNIITTDYSCRCGRSYRMIVTKVITETVIYEDEDGNEMDYEEVIG